MALAQAQPAICVPGAVLGALSALRRPIIVGHVTPDADCLASMLAVGRVWPGDGGPGRGACLPAGSVSRRLAFLVEWACVPVVGPAALPAADGFVVVDTAKMARCNVGADSPDDWAAGRPVVNIDHHQTNTRFGTVNWVVPEATSSAELVYHAIRAGGRPIDEPTASLLYAGLHSDNRGFLVSDPGGGALSVAAELVRAGARTAEIGQRLYRSLRPCELALLKVIYANTRRACRGLVAYSTANHAEIIGAGCTAADIDEQVEVPRSLEGIAIAVLLSEGVQGRVRINLRAEPGYTVLPLAQALGGGGHSQAAGAVLEGTVTQALDLVLPLVEGKLEALRVDEG